MLVGRGAEVGFAHGWLDGVRTGRAALLRIEGEPGIGKSEFLAELVAWAARECGFTTFVGRGEALGEGRPFGALVDAGLSRPLAETLDRASIPAADDVTRVSPLEAEPELRSLLVDRAVDALELLAGTAPVLVALDDLQWIDIASVLAVTTALRRCADLPLAIVVTERPHLRRPELTHLLDSLAPDVLALAPLSGESVADLCRSTIGAAPAADLAQLLDRCGGNPLLLVETLTSLREHGDLTVAEGLARRRTGGAESVSLPDTVRRRMAPLEGEIRAVAAIAALMGSRFTLGDLAAVTGRSSLELLPLIEDLISAHLMRDDGDALAFRHDLLRETVVEALPPSMRAELHQTIADGLQSAGAPLARIAEHVALATPAGSPAAIDVLQRAARDVVSRDPATATRLLRSAVARGARRMRPNATSSAPIWSTRSTWNARTAEAQELAAEMLMRPLAPEVEARLHSALGRALLLLGRPQESVEHELRVVELQAATGRSTAWARAECAMCRLFSVDLDGALHDARAAVGLAAGGRETMAHVLALCVETFALNTVGNTDAAVESGRVAVTLADGTPALEGHRLHPQLFYGVALQTFGRHAEAAAAFRRGRELGEALGAAWALPIYHFATALAQWDAGAWDDLLAEVDAGIAYGADKGSTIAQVWAYAVAARVHLHRGDRDAASAALDRGDAVLAAGGLQYGIDWFVLSRALLLEATGDAAEACGLLALGWETAVGLQAEAGLTTFGPDLVRLAIDTDRGRAGDVVARLQELADRHPLDLVTRGRSRRATGLFRRDAAALLEAVEAFDTLHHRFEAAVVRLEAATLCAEAERERAGVLAEEALVVFDDLATRAESERAPRCSRKWGGRAARRRVALPSAGPR